jgi:cellulose biosynthesis protein BcsQ
MGSGRSKQQEEQDNQDDQDDQGDDDNYDDKDEVIHQQQVLIEDLMVKLEKHMMVNPKVFETFLPENIALRSSQLLEGNKKASEEAYNEMKEILHKLQQINTVGHQHSEHQCSENSSSKR